MTSLVLWIIQESSITLIFLKQAQDRFPSFTTEEFWWMQLKEYQCECLALNRWPENDKEGREEGKKWREEGSWVVTARKGPKRRTNQRQKMSERCGLSDINISEVHENGLCLNWKSAIRRRRQCLFLQINAMREPLEIGATISSPIPSPISTTPVRLLSRVPWT